MLRILAVLLLLVALVASAHAAAPVADFSANATAGPAPLTVAFSDASTGNATAWAWDFETDGTIDATEQHPVCTYQDPGTYTVTLNASNQDGSNAVAKVDYITVAGGVVPATTTPASGGAVALQETHGETWIRWTWEAVNLSANQTLVGLYDGVPVLNITANTTFPPTLYYRGDLNPNEYHLFDLALVDTSTGAPVVERADLGVTTSQGSVFYYILFVVALAVALVGAVIPNRYMALVLLMFSFLVAAGVAVGTTASNASFSVIAIMLAVVTGGGMIFVLYDLVKSHVGWENDEY